MLPCVMTNAMYYRGSDPLYPILATINQKLNIFVKF